jgi:hypothetical protein
MVRFFQRYFEYRRVGYSRLNALHFAWLVTTARRPLPSR